MKCVIKVLSILCNIYCHISRTGKIIQL